MPAKPKLARRSTAVMVFVAGMDDFGKVQKVAHFSRSPRLPTDLQFVVFAVCRMGERSNTHQLVTVERANCDAAPFIPRLACGIQLS